MKKQGLICQITRYQNKEAAGASPIEVRSFCVPDEHSVLTTKVKVSNFPIYHHDR